ncbi:MAG: PQQ-binding-like beta-propeller repeat protein [Hyphomicrobiaceae bacterium]|nr:PQQ-binding-like beta-propeller repeat protein [Hyphomicrobiaceae bacterium]
MRSVFRLALVAALMGLSACASFEDTLDTINPFSEREVPLPGERRSLAGVNDPTEGVTAQPVSIPGPGGSPEWPLPGGNLSHNPGHVALTGGGGWRVDAGESTRRIRITAEPVVSGGRAYVYDVNGNVTAVSMSGGGRAWRVALRPEGETSASPNGGVAVGEGRVYVATGFGQVVALDPASGATVWARDLPAPALSAPTVANGKVFVVSQSNTVHALSAADGTELWTFRGIPASAGVVGAGAPAVEGSTVIVPFSSGEIAALNIENGEMRWSDAVTAGARFSAITSLNDVAGHPVVAGGIVIASGAGGRTIAVNVGSGNRVWETNVGSTNTPIVAGDVIYLIDLQNRFVAMSRTDGAIRWVQPLPGNEGRDREAWTGPSLAGGSLWAASSEGRLTRADPATGQILETRDIGPAVYVQPIAASGRLLLLAGDGTLIAAN